MRLAYEQGCLAAKQAFFRGDWGPLAGSLFPSSAVASGILGAGAEAIDTPKGGSKILRGIGVGGGAAIASLAVHKMATRIAAAVAAKYGLGPFAETLLSAIPTGLAQYGASHGGRALATRVEEAFKKKDVRIP